jgi:hypothetical protein
MMIQLKKIIVLIVFSVLIFSSCRVEDINVDTKFLRNNSTVANLMDNTSLNDGSTDNIIDNANCFTVKLPVTVIANNIQVIVNTEADYAAVETIFDASDVDTDTLEIIFPITIILSNFKEEIVTNQSEFENFRSTCNGENEFDDDIECLDFNYPITGSIFDTVTNQTNTFTINSDKELHTFLEDLDNDDVVSINFPITVILFDGTVVNIADLDQLETIIDNAKDDCDEDDDFDYNDDDCVGCSTNQLETLLTGCTDWTVDKLELSNVKLEDNYIGFTFNFFNDGTITVIDGATNHSGTWSSSGTGQNITVIVNIPTLPDFNANWNLHEIEDFPGQKKVDLRKNGGDDRLRFETPCN